MSPHVPPPSRVVECGDGIAWLQTATLTNAHAVVTSLPDATELPGRDREVWRGWFIDVAALICERIADEGVAVFFQTDVVEQGRWEDKAFLVASGAARAGAACLFHQVVLRAPAGVATRGRPGYAHLLAFSRSLRLPTGARGADVVPTLGEMAWSRGMGTAACEAVARFLREATSCRIVVDPFCGLGTMLAVANAVGLDAVGVERSAPRAARAATLRFVPGHGLGRVSKCSVREPAGAVARAGSGGEGARRRVLDPLRAHSPSTPPRSPAPAGAAGALLKHDLT